jgi:hypothetical protein
VDEGVEAEMVVEKVLEEADVVDAEELQEEEAAERGGEEAEETEECDGNRDAALLWRRAYCCGSNE